MIVQFIEGVVLPTSVLPKLLFVEPLNVALCLPRPLSSSWGGAPIGTPSRPSVATLAPGPGGEKWIRTLHPAEGSSMPVPVEQSAGWPDKRVNPDPIAALK